MRPLGVAEQKADKLQFELKVLCSIFTLDPKFSGIQTRMHVYGFYYLFLNRKYQSQFKMLKINVQVSAATTACDLLAAIH